MNTRANGSRPSGSGARCRWLGETPAMVVWRLVHHCPLLEHFAQRYRAPKTPVAIQQCLKALEAIDESWRLGNVQEDWAILVANDRRILGNDRDQALAFSLAEATQVFGGLETTINACTQCPANATRHAVAATNSVSLAGCSQVLVFGSLTQLSAQTRALSSSPLPILRPTWSSSKVAPTTNDALIDAVAGPLFEGGKLRQLVGARTPAELWQKLWFSRDVVVHWDSARILALVNDLKGGPTTGTQEEELSLTGWHQFCAAASSALKHGKNLETEYIPRGFSDGRDWWLSPHCSHCGATMAAEVSPCHVCGRTGGPIPEQKRRIMGWAPYRPLSTLLGSEAAEQLVQTASIQRGPNG